MPSQRSRRLLLAAAISGVVSVFVALALVEVTLQAALRFSPDSGRVIEALREIYLEGMSLIQYDPACARYDSRLTYRLKAPGCEFGSFEFENAYEVNSLGLRDDEASLRSPEIVVLGDSLAMGWGVDQSESFSELVEAMLSRPVLNMGISSYGTARQVMALERISGLGVRAVVIQYSSNDVRENLEFTSRGGSLPTMSEAEYQSWQRRFENSRPYAFGNWVRTLVGRRLVDPLRRRLGLASGFVGLGSNPPPGTGGVPEVGVEREARAFLETLALGPELLRRVPLLVIHLPDDRVASDAFLDALRRSELGALGGAFGGGLRTFGLEGELRSAHFFRVDSHLNAAGHRVVAEVLAPELAALLGER